MVRTLGWDSLFLPNVPFPVASGGGLGTRRPAALGGVSEHGASVALAEPPQLCEGCFRNLSWNQRSLSMFNVGKDAPLLELTYTQQEIV